MNTQCLPAEAVNWIIIKNQIAKAGSILNHYF